MNEDLDEVFDGFQVHRCVKYAFYGWDIQFFPESWGLAWAGVVGLGLLSLGWGNELVASVEGTFWIRVRVRVRVRVRGVGDGWVRSGIFA